MANEWTLNVKPGPTATRINNTTERTLIRNYSSTDAVWVSINQNVTPGNGQKIGPLGFIHLTGTKTKANDSSAWAVVDTGVTNEVQLGISDDFGDPVNPVDVAIATANALNRVTLIETVDWSGGSPVLVDASNYAGVLIVDDSGSLGCDFTAEWLGPDSGFTTRGTNKIHCFAGPVASQATQIVPVPNSWTLRNPGINILRLFDNSAGNGGLQVYGLGRDPGCVHLNSLNGPGWSSGGFYLFTQSQVMVANTTYQVAVPPVGPATSTFDGVQFGGRAMLAFHLSTATAVRGVLWLAVHTESGVVVNTPVMNTNEMVDLGGGSGFNGLKEISLPMTPYTFAFRCTTAGTTSMFLSAVPVV